MLVKSIENNFVPFNNHEIVITLKITDAKKDITTINNLINNQPEFDFGELSWKKLFDILPEEKEILTFLKLKYECKK